MATTRRRTRRRPSSGQQQLLGPCRRRRGLLGAAIRSSTKVGAGGGGADLSEVDGSSAEKSSANGILDEEGGGKESFSPTSSVALEAASTPAPTRALFDLLRRCSWDSALRRCAFHPSDASYRVKRPFHEKYDCSGERDNPGRHQPSAIAGRHFGEAYWRCESGYTPLHMAVLKGAPPVVVREIMAAHPSAATESGEVDCKAPLHLMTEIPSRINEETVRSFIDRYPPSAPWLGLTIGLPDDVADIVLSFVPHPALLRDVRGQTPLHKMCKRRSRMSPCVETMAVSCPRALRLTDRKGWTPLHAFLFGRSPPPLAPYVRLFGTLADLAGSDVLGKVNPGGVSPLHIACLSLQRADVIRAILRRSPDSASVKGCHGVLPLHLLIVRASRSTADVGARSKFIGVVRDLAKADPACLSAPIPPYQFSLLDFVLPAEEANGAGPPPGQQHGPVYRGPMGGEVAAIFRKVNHDHIMELERREAAEKAEAEASAAPEGEGNGRTTARTVESAGGS